MQLGLACPMYTSGTRACLISALPEVVTRFVHTVPRLALDLNTDHPLTRLSWQLGRSDSLTLSLTRQGRCVAIMNP